MHSKLLIVNYDFFHLRRCGQKLSGQTYFKFYILIDFIPNYQTFKLNNSKILVYMFCTTLKKLNGLIKSFLQITGHVHIHNVKIIGTSVHIYGSIN